MMSIESDETRLAMLQAVGGLTVQAARGTFVAVFSDDYLAGGGGVADVEMSAPQLSCRTSDVARLKIIKEDRLTIAGVPYTVVGHRPDGTGMTQLQVHEE